MYMYVYTCVSTCTCMHRPAYVQYLLLDSLISLDPLICDCDSYRATSLDCVHMTSCVHYTMQRFSDGRLAGAVTSPSPLLPLSSDGCVSSCFSCLFFAHLPWLRTAASSLLVFVGLFPPPLTVFHFTNKST